MASAGVSRPNDLSVFGGFLRGVFRVSELQIVGRADHARLQAEQNADLVALAAQPHGAPG